MDSIQTNSCKQDNHILKSNLWKFFKALRAQANHIYCLLVASPIHYAWITIIDKFDATIQKRISITQFVNSFKKMPSTDKYYRLSINTYDLETSRRITFEATLQQELSLEDVTALFAAIIANHCVEARGRGERFELTPQVMLKYKFKARYIDDLQPIILECNSRIDNETIN